jgi:Protein of unknown function (DUF1569)
MNPCHPRSIYLFSRTTICRAPLAIQASTNGLGWTSRQKICNLCIDFISMKNIFQESEKEKLLLRLSRFTPSHTRKWGTLSAAQILPHLADPFRAELGDRPVPYKPNLFGQFILRQFISQVFPWPKGAPTSSAILPDKAGTKPGDFEEDRVALLVLIQRFVDHSPSKPFALHPLFGKLSNKQWGRAMWRHIDHHLRQFGV